jgi:hypothetical protein
LRIGVALAAIRIFLSILPTFLMLLGIPRPVSAAEPPAIPWLFAHAYKLPSKYTNQESGYFSIVDGKNGRLYIGTAKYGVAHLLGFQWASWRLLGPSDRY